MKSNAYFCENEPETYVSPTAGLRWLKVHDFGCDWHLHQRQPLLQTARFQKVMRLYISHRRVLPKNPTQKPVMKE